MNEFIGWNLWHNDKENECGKCGMKDKKGGCCKDEQKQLKLSADQNHSQVIAFVFGQFFSPIIFSHYTICHFTQPTTVALLFPTNNAPPNRWQKIPQYLSNCVFLI
jgi:hypothetical protein